MNSPALLDAIEGALAAMESVPTLYRRPCMSIAIGQLRWHRKALLRALETENASRREDERAVLEAKLA